MALKTWRKPVNSVIRWFFLWSSQDKRGGGRHEGTSSSCALPNVGFYGSPQSALPGVLEPTKPVVDIPPCWVLHLLASSYTFWHHFILYISLSLPLLPLVIPIIMMFSHASLFIFSPFITCPNTMFVSFLLSSEDT